jgi:hypothetical protein
MSAKKTPSCNRNRISDLEAFVAIPHLEQVAEPLLACFDEETALNFVIFLAVRAAFGSTEEADSVLASTRLWADLRCSAARVGRVLPASPITANQWYHQRRKLSVSTITETSQAATLVSLNLARLVGLCDPDTDMDPRAPKRENTVLVDGTVFEPRSRGGMRHPGKPTTEEVAEQDDGAQSDHNRGIDYGQPVSVASVRGSAPQQRVLLGMHPFKDGNEMGASMNLIHHLSRTSDGGVHAIDCDGLMGDQAFEEIMGLGLVPVARMSAATKNTTHVEIEDATVPNRPSTRNKRAVAKNSKRRLRAKRIPEPVKGCSNGCIHYPWAVDGSLVVLDSPRDPQGSDPRIPPSSLRWGSLGTNQQYLQVPHLIATYTYDCGGIPQRVEFNLGDQPWSGVDKDKRLVRYLRPVPESADRFRQLFSLREDAESSISTLKRGQYDFGRADADKIDWVWLNLLGSMLLRNAVCWDIHASHHTLAAQKHQERLQRR